MKSYSKTLLSIALIFAVQSATVFAADNLVARGKYLVQIGGCNDCHTPGYSQQGGKIPLEKWLTGDQVGFQGPWGTTFPTNLRLSMQNLTEKEWVQKAKKLEARPPMPWFNVRAMAEKDQRAIYRFIKSLGPAGEKSTEYVPPGKETKNMFIVFTPVTMTPSVPVNSPALTDKHAALENK